MGCGTSKARGSGNLSGAKAAVSPIGLVFGEKYKVISRLGSGSFGRVYLGTDLTNGCEVAIKLEEVVNTDVSAQIQHQKKPKPSLLEKEAGIMDALTKRDSSVYCVPGHERKGKLSGCKIPAFLWYGTAFGFHALIMELLGPSLADVVKLCNPGAPTFLRRFSLMTVAVIGIQAVRIIESIHTLGYVHRDIKPANFLMSTNSRHNRLFLIDFGLAKSYWRTTQTQTQRHGGEGESESENVAEHGVHIDKEISRGFSVGTPQFASLNAHKGLNLSRRDDLEAIGYMLVFFAKGLPWVHRSRPHGGRHRGGVDVSFSAMHLNKTSTSIESLCEGLPPQYTLFMKHVKGLEFDQIPDYDLLISLLKETLLSGAEGGGGGGGGVSGSRSSVMRNSSSSIGSHSQTHSHSHSAGSVNAGMSMSTDYDYDGWDPASVVCDWNNMAEDTMQDRDNRQIGSSQTSFMSENIRASRSVQSTQSAHSGQSEEKERGERD